MPNMKYMIRCDIEGISGVVSYEQAEPGKSEYELGLRLFRSDLCACIDGLLAGGAGEVVIYDEHYYGRNIDPTWLPERVSFIAGKPPYRADWAGGLDDSFAGLILVGFHSKYGTPGGLLHHSYELDIRDLRLNGVSVGEIGMETAIAGDFGVPLLLVTVDSAGCAEAAALVPGTKTVAVKESLGETGGQCLPLNVTAAMIRQAAKDVVGNPPAAKVWKIEDGVTLEISFNPGSYANAVRRLTATRRNRICWPGASATGRSRGRRSLAWHRGSFHSQQLHVHPCVHANGTKVLYTADPQAYGQIFIVDVPEWGALPDRATVTNNKEVYDVRNWQDDVRNHLPRKRGRARRRAVGGRRPVPAAVPFPAAGAVDERHLRRALARGLVPHILPVQPVRRPLRLERRQRLLGPCPQPRSRPLGAPADRRSAVGRRGQLPVRQRQRHAPGRRHADALLRAHAAAAPRRHAPPPPAVGGVTA